MTSTLSDDDARSTDKHEGLRVGERCRTGDGKGERRMRVVTNEVGCRRRRVINCTVGTEEGDRDVGHVSARFL